MPFCFQSFIWFLISLQVCNGDVYIRIPTKEMASLAERKVSLIARGTSITDDKTISSNDSKAGGDTMSTEKVKEDLKSHLRGYGVDWSTVTVISTSAVIQTETVPQSMFEKVTMFYCCVQCGKVFWEGSHFDRVCEQFSHVLDVEASGHSVYDQLQENWG